MSNTWKMIWEAHPDLFIARNWKEYPEDKKKASRLPPQFDYFLGCDTALRVGIIASSSAVREEEFLLAGVLWGNRLSNGLKTVIYFVAPDFSSAFLNGLCKIGGTISARAVYWREKLKPSLYLIPEEQQCSQIRYAIGEERLDWKRWAIGLNPVAQQQLKIVNMFFDSLVNRGVRAIIKPLYIAFVWGNFEIAEVRRKGKKFELSSKLKWLKNSEQISGWQRQGWVDASGLLNSEFCSVILSIIDYLESLEQEGKLRNHDLLALWFHQHNEFIESLWGSPWPWPWQPKERSENAVLELEEWYFFQGNGQLSAVCPIFEKPLVKAARSILLANVLERSLLLVNIKNAHGVNLVWDGRVHWLTTAGIEEELRRWYNWLKDVDKFPICTLPSDWREKGIYGLNCQSTFVNHSSMQKGYL